MLRIVIWHISWDIGAKIKSFLKLGYLYYVHKYLEQKNHNIHQNWYMLQPWIFLDEINFLLDRDLRNDAEYIEPQQ